jgi:AraC-like DNA-binding protein
LRLIRKAGTVLADPMAHWGRPPLLFASKDLQNASIRAAATGLARRPVSNPRMLKPPDTISIAFVHGMLSGVEAPVASLLADSGIAPDLLDEPAARVTADQYVALFSLLMERRDDEFLGLLSRPLHRGTFALIARSCLGNATLSDSLRRLCATFRLLQDDMELVVVSDGGAVGLRLVFHAGLLAGCTFLHELVLRVFWRLIAWLHGGRLKPARFDFAFATPAHSAEYGKVFPGQVRFEQAHSTVWFDAASLSVPMLRDASALRAFLAQAPGIVIIPQRSDTAVSARVRAHLQHAHPAWPDLAAVSSFLHLSASTLQRRLSAEGTTFQALKDQLRRDIAIQHLSSTPVALTTLALQLGFADGPAFQRAFKAWTGSPPGAYRRSPSSARGRGVRVEPSRPGQA